MATNPRRPTANEVLQDRAIRHAIYLQRLKSGEANRILNLLARTVYSDLRRTIRQRVARMERLGSDTGPVTTARLDEIEQAIREVTASLDQAREALETRLAGIGNAEAKFQTKAIRDASPVELDITTPSPRMLQSIVTARPMQGRLMRDWWSGLETNLRTNITREIGVGIALGKTNQQIVKALLDPGGGALAVSRRHAEAIVRTSIAHVSNHARQATYEQNGDIVDQWQWISTLDHRTCTICIPLDGTTWPLGEGPPNPDGKGMLKGKDAHWNCRCDSCPVLKSWKELGIDLKEMSPGTRASMNGQVAAKTTYPEWLKSQSAEIQDEVLGPTRARLFRAGTVDVTEFVDDRGNLLTLEELQAREGLSADDVAVRRATTTAVAPRAAASRDDGPVVVTPRGDTGPAIPAPSQEFLQEQARREAEARAQAATVRGQLAAVEREIQRLERSIRLATAFGPLGPNARRFLRQDQAALAALISQRDTLRRQLRG